MTEVMTDKTSKEKEMEDVAVRVLLGIFVTACIILMFVAFAKPSKPTEEISAEVFSNVKGYIETIHGRELDIAKTMFENAIEEGGHRVDDSFIRIWTDEGLETMSFYWKCGDQYYCTQICGSDQYYPFREAEYIQGWYQSGSIKSVQYKSGYLVVDSDIKVPTEA